MSELKLRTQLLASLVLVVLLLLLNVAFVYRSVVSLRETAAVVARAQRVIATSSILEKHAVDLETGVRGFVITGNEDFLEPYVSGRAATSEKLQSLEELVADSPAQLKRVRSMHDAIENWIETAGVPAIDGKRKALAVDADSAQFQNMVGRGPGKAILERIGSEAASLRQDLLEANNVEAGKRLASAARNLSDRLVAQRNFLVTGREEDLVPFREAQAALDKNLLALGKELGSTPATGVVLLRRLADDWFSLAGKPEIDYRRRLSQAIAAHDATLSLVRRSAGKTIMDKLRGVFDAFNDRERELLTRRDMEAEAASAAAITASFTWTLLAILIGSLVMTYFGRKVLRQVGGEPAEIAAIADQVSKGSLDISLPVGEAEATGILGSVRRMVLSLKRSRDDAGKQDWLEKGLVRLNEGLRGEQDVHALAVKSTHELATQVGAQVGALYVAESREGSPEALLSLVGSYAYSPRSNLPNKFELGEGLVGQAALERRQILLANVPEDYVRVVSGLGDAAPRFICVTPIMFEERVRGVVEVGTLAELDATQLAYLTQGARAVGVALHSAQTRERVSAELKRSQKLTEELRVQEEELRVSNEELEEKNELLQRQKMEVERARREMAEKAAELELASKYKSEFLANMSHELRTPLNSLLLLARGLVDNKPGNLTSEQVECAQVIHGAGSDLLSLINEILDLSKVESGLMELETRDVLLRDLAAGLQEQFGRMAAEQKTDLTMELEPGLPEEIATDAKRVQQVLRNLVSNALKFTEKGSVQVRFHRPESGKRPAGFAANSGDWVAISVRDTGIGIDAENQKLVFEAFRQIDGGSARRCSGTGLGLSISRELARILGGGIELQSSLGSGSTFTLYLPLRPSEDKATTAGVRAPAVSLPRDTPDSPASEELVRDDRDTVQAGERTLLAIEDDATFASLLVTQSHEAGFKCIAAKSGEEGLNLAKKLQPSAILLDLRLAGIDGWHVLGGLQDDMLTRHIPVYVLSGEDSSPRGLRKGVVGHLVKPVTPEDLAGVFEKLEATLSRKVKHLLVVEPDEAARKLVVAIVEGPDIVVEEASSTQEAVDAFARRQFDCLILELGIGDSSAERLLEVLEGHSGRQMPPVIVYAARAISREEESLLREYTDSIIIKGAHSEERLLDDVALFLHRQVGSMPPRQQQLLTELHTSDSVFKGKTVIVVDDDMRSAFALSRVLSEHGMLVSKAENGKKALEVLDENPACDLILMDIMMPVMDGYQAIKAIRAQERFARLPIIALTAKAMTGDRKDCLQAGANDYLTKPIDQTRLLSMMRVWLCR